MNNRLYRSTDDRVLAGVAGGMAETYDLDPALVRVGWALLILVSGGLFLLLYIIMALVVPLRPANMPPTWMGAPTDASGATAPADGTPPPDYTRWRYHRHRGNGAGALVIGLILIVVGGIFLVRQFVPSLNTDLLWPLVIIGIGLVLILAAFARSSDR